MDDEFTKINYYFSEGAKLWPRQPDLVVGRDFYLLWESIQQPRPFPVDPAALELFGQHLEVNGTDEPHIGYFLWDNVEMCAALALESPSWEHRFLLTFDNGSPRVYETPAVMRENTELTHGEKLEVIFDIIAGYRESNPGKNILDLSKKEYLERLETIAPRHDPMSVKAMRRLPAASIKKLVEEAAEDMAEDEISDQLSLPLDGNYQPAAEKRPAPGHIKPFNATIESITPWQITSLLQLITAAGKLTFEAENFYILSFRDTTFIGSPSHGEITVRFKPDDQMLIQEGDLLTVFCHGERDPVGTFRADLYDGQSIYGRLRCRDQEQITDHQDQLFAKPRKSPREFLYLAMEALTSKFRTGTLNAIQGSLRHILGLEPSNCCLGVDVDAPEFLDQTQQKAWSSAVDDDNPVVLIQGPPGTGKTRVLEEVVRTLCKLKLRVLVAAPSNAAVDNICRRVVDLPVLRFGRNQESIAPDIVQACWIGKEENISSFIALRQRHGGGSIYLGTHVALLRDDLIDHELANNGLFDVIIFDEAGMASMQEFLLSAAMSRRTVLFGDHQQLPPFPLPAPVVASLETEHGPIPAGGWAAITRSALQWLAEERLFPVIMLQSSYRCQNPRLLRFASTLFYDAGVKPSGNAEYYRLPYQERMKKYPPSTLKLIRTSHLPRELRQEQLLLEGGKPGIENRLEAALCCREVYHALKQYPMDEICVITPYRRQLRLIRDAMNHHTAEKAVGHAITPKDWENFLFNRIATVDSFQGSESDIVIISYVRSPEADSIGFVDDANRINVAHTRCRREMVVIGDLASLKANARNNIFLRMERAFERDGIVIEPSHTEAAELLARCFPPKNETRNHSVRLAP